jgi:peptide deformylase
VLEDSPEYVMSRPAGKAAQMQRRPFELIAICNLKLKPLGQSGARFYEGCLSIPDYQVSMHAAVQR